MDTIFNNNHDSTSTLLSTNGGGGVSSRDISDDFVMPETSSHSIQPSVAHTIAFPSLSSTSSASASASATHISPRTETTTSTTSDLERSHSSISPPKVATATATASIQNNISGTEMHVPEACTNNSVGAASNGSSGSTSSSSSASGNSSGTSNASSTAAPVSISVQPNWPTIDLLYANKCLPFISEKNVTGRGESPIKRCTPVQSVHG